MRRAVAAGLAALALAAVEAARADGAPDLMSPRAGQTDWTAGVEAGATTDASVVQVRENAIPGSILRYSQLGLDMAPSIGAGARHWLTRRDAVSFGARWTLQRGAGPVTSPFDFNGATVASGQTVSTNADLFVLSARYVRRLASSVDGAWDFRASAGLDYAHQSFAIDGGHAPTTAGSQGTETKENVFSIAELPVPAAGLEFWARVAPGILASVSAGGSWVNHWDTLRREGGEMFLSQSSFEAHARLVENARRRGRPWLWAGWFYRYFMENQTSNEDGNYARAESFGPEAGVGVSF